MVVTRFASQLFFAVSFLFWISPACAEELEFDSALAPLKELLATTDVQQQVLQDRLDLAFKDITEDYESGIGFAVRKTFPSENWDISLVSSQRTDGTFQKIMHLFTKSGDEYNDGTTPTFCQEVSSFLKLELGEPNMTLDISVPLPDENNWISFTRLTTTWHHQGLGIHSFCSAVHFYMAQADGGQIVTSPAFALITLTDIENMQTIQALSPVTCSYQGTLRDAEFPSGIEQDLTFDFYLNETDNELLSLEKRILASNVLFTDSEIFGVWEDTKFTRELRINRYSGASTLSVQSVSEDSDTSYNSRSGECIAYTERKF